MKSGNIPGTLFPIREMDGATGLAFLDKVFYVTTGIMLTQIRNITGIDGTTLQNWVKRGWVPGPKGKSYSREHLARILLINMMRDTMQLSRVMYLLCYINGTEPEDRVIAESDLYDYVCRVTAKVSDTLAEGMDALDGAIDEVLADYDEPAAGAKRRVAAGIRIIVLTYCAGMIKAMADDTVDELGADKKRKR